MDTQQKTLRRLRRRNRIRAKVAGTAQRPRLAIFRSNTQISAQLIDDEAGNTIASATTATVKGDTQRERALAAAVVLAKAAKDRGITTVVFDRGGYMYAGNIKAFADAAREAGLVF